MAYNTTIKIKTDFITLTTNWANTYKLSRSTVINHCISKLQKSKYLERFIKQGITRNTIGNKTATIWSTTKGIYNYVQHLKKKYECSMNDIILAAISYVAINSKKPKYLDYTFSRVVEKNKNIYKRSYLL